MSRWQMPSGAGFTLIEMVMALALSFVTVTAVYSLYVSVPSIIITPAIVGLCPVMSHKHSVSNAI